MRKLFLSTIILYAQSIVADVQESERKYIEVTGSSETEVVPDEIHLLIQIREYQKEEFVPKSEPKDYKTRVPSEWIEKDLRRVLNRAGTSDEAIRVQEIGDYRRQKGKEFLIDKQLDTRFTDLEKINAVIKKINMEGIESMRIGELKYKDLPNYRKQGKIEVLKAVRKKASYLVEAMGQGLDEVIRIAEPASSYVSPYSPYQTQSSISAETATTEQCRIIKLRYEMTTRSAVEQYGQGENVYKGIDYVNWQKCSTSELLLGD